MKLLAIDAGNSRIKWGIHADGAWIEQGAIPTGEAEPLAEAFGRAAFDRAVIANVAGEAVAQRLAAVVGADADVRWVSGRTEQCGVRSSYADPAQLGPDRWAALIGSRHLYAGPCVVVNAGTTMTVDALSAESIFLGGCIVAGFELMRSALDANTARLKKRDGVFSFFPDNTGDAIASGALNALAGTIDRMCRYLVDTGEDEPVIVLSGGNAPLLAPHLNGRVQLVDNLVLEGLVRIGASDV
jgi:type III pantothenate kinase